MDENIGVNYFSHLTFSWSVLMENYSLLLILFLHGTGPLFFSMLYRKLTFKYIRIIQKKKSMITI